MDELRDRPTLLPIGRGIRHKPPTFDVSCIALPVSRISMKIVNNARPYIAMIQAGPQVRMLELFAVLL